MSKRLKILCCVGLMVFRNFSKNGFGYVVANEQQGRACIQDSGCRTVPTLGLVDMRTCLGTYLELLDVKEQAKALKTLVAEANH